MQCDIPQPERLLRVGEVLRRVPVSKSTWWNWVKNGAAPAPVRIGGNVTCWREAEIAAFVAGASAKAAP